MRRNLEIESPDDDEYENPFYMDEDEPEERYRPRKTLDDAKEILDDWLDGSNEEKIKNANSAWTYPDLWTARKMNLVFIEALIGKFGHNGLPDVEFGVPELRRTKTELKNRYALTAVLTAIRTLEGLPEHERRQLTSTPRKGGRSSVFGPQPLQRYIAQHMPESKGITYGRTEKMLEVAQKEYRSKVMMLNRLVKMIYRLNGSWDLEFSLEHLRLLEYLICYYKIKSLAEYQREIDRWKMDSFLYIKFNMHQSGEFSDIYIEEENFFSE